jgi:hypothetical protein
VKTQKTRACALALVLATAFGAASWAARVIPNRLDLAQAPGTTETYTLLLEGDQEASEEVRLYLGDWKRAADGEHDWGIPVNGARWTFDEAFLVGAWSRSSIRWPTERMDCRSLGHFGPTPPK